MTDLTARLREKNLRRTPVRVALLEELATHGCVLSVPALQQRLVAHDLQPNKTTLYRQLETLAAADLVTAVPLPIGTGYELTSSTHHHHFVCERCRGLTPIHTPAAEAELHQLQAALAKKGFQPKSHSMDIRGLCPNCS